MSHRLWWLVAFCALAIEHEPSPRPDGSAPTAAQAEPSPAPLAGRRAAARGG